LSPTPNLTLEELLQQIKDRQGKDAFNIIAETVEKVTIPATGYDYLASPVKEGLVKVIFTTNYDRLMENALSKVIGENFRVVARLDDFENFNIEIEPKEPVIFKLHGSVDDLESMEGAWEDVQSFPVGKARVLAPYIEHYGILFVGYACADKDVGSLIEQSAIRRKDRRCYTINPQAPTDRILNFLTLLKSKSNHIVSTSDGFFEDLVRKLRKSQSQPAIPSELIAERARCMLARDSVRKARKIQLDDLRRNDLKTLTTKVQSIMAPLYGMINANEGVEVSYYVRDLQESGYWNHKAPRTQVEQIVTNSGERFLTEFEVEVRQIIDGTLIYPILFSDVDIF
jgi:hypothetical protein